MGTDTRASDRADTPPQTLADDERAVAEQIDFLNGMVILLFGLGLFFAGAGVLFEIGVDTNPDREGTAHNADQRLVEDVLANGTGTLTLDPECADAYFEMDEHGECGFTPAVFDTSAPTELHWLRHSLGIEESLRANVTVVDGDGTSPDTGSIVTGESGTVYALGPEPPAGATIVESNRFVAAGDGEYYTVFVRVW